MLTPSGARCGSPRPATAAPSSITNALSTTTPAEEDHSNLEDDDDSIRDTSPLTGRTKGQSDARSSGALQSKSDSNGRFRSSGQQNEELRVAKQGAEQKVRKLERSLDTKTRKIFELERIVSDLEIASQNAATAARGEERPQEIELSQMTAASNRAVRIAAQPDREPECGREPNVTGRAGRRRSAFAKKFASRRSASRSWCVRSPR